MSALADRRLLGRTATLRAAVHPRHYRQRRDGSPRRHPRLASSPGPYPVGTYAAALRDRLRGFTRVQVFGEVFGFKAGRAKVWFELRDAGGALPCSMWREDFEQAAARARWPTARRWSSRAGATTTPAREPPRPGSASPSRACGSPARATCSPSSSSCGASCTPRACSRRRRRSRCRSCRAASASSPASPARRVTTSWPACAAAGGRGGSCGASRPSRTAMPRPRSRARCRTWRRARRST